MVEVRTYAGAIGRSSFQTYVEMRIEGDDRMPKGLPRWSG
jgi:acyl-CoA thioester hydrolase